MSPSRRRFRSRRSVLRFLGVAGSGFLTGCGESSSAGQNAGTTLTTESTTRRTSTTEPSTPAPLPPEGTINAIPTKPDAEWSDAGVFDILDGDVDYELNLKEARGRHYDDLEQYSSGRGDLDSPRLTTFVNNVLDDAEYRADLVEEANKEFDADMDDPFEPAEYRKDAPFGTRMRDSNFQDMWNIFTYLAYGAPSSTQNQPKAAVIQGLERKIGADTIVWGHQSGHGGHGLISALENPTYDPEEFNRQRTYVIETDPREEYQVMNLAEEGYRNNGAHPVETENMDVINRTWGKMISSMSSEEEWVAEKKEQGWVADNEAIADAVEQYKEFLLDPNKDSGQKYMDLMAVTYELGYDQRMKEKDIFTSSEAIRYS